MPIDDLENGQDEAFHGAFFINNGTNRGDKNEGPCVPRVLGEIKCPAEARCDTFGLSKVNRVVLCTVVYAGSGIVSLFFFFLLFFSLASLAPMLQMPGRYRSLFLMNVPSQLMREAGQPWKSKPTP